MGENKEFKSEQKGFPMRGKEEYGGRLPSNRILKGEIRPSSKDKWRDWPTMKGR